MKEIWFDQLIEAQNHAPWAAFNKSQAREEQWFGEKDWSTSIYVTNIDVRRAVQIPKAEQQLNISRIANKCHYRETFQIRFLFPLNLKKLEKELKKPMSLLSENKNLNQGNYQNNLFNDQLSRTNDLTVKTPDLQHILYTGWPGQEARRDSGARWQWAVPYAWGQPSVTARLNPSASPSRDGYLRTLTASHSNRKHFKVSQRLDSL